MPRRHTYSEALNSPRSISEIDITDPSDLPDVT